MLRETAEARTIVLTSAIPSSCSRETGLFRGQDRGGYGELMLFALSIDGTLTTVYCYRSDYQLEGNHT